jgi:hypothetical protein
MNTFTTQDGFTWYILQPKVAKYLHDMNYCEVYRLFDDESESLCEDGHNFSDDSVRYGIEYPSQSVVHALCGAELVKAFENGEQDTCHDLVFKARMGDLTFFSPFAKPKAVLDNLRGCDAVTFITADQFLSIITND